MIKISLEQVREMAERARGSQLVRVILHWSAGHYSQFFRDYDIQIDGDGQIWAPDLILEDVEAHCWRRNSDSIGVALAACYNGTTRDLGAEAPTEAQIQTMIRVIVQICQGLGWPIDRQHVLTHEEMATIDGYGPGSGDPETRWDLWFLRNGEAPGTGGEQLRASARSILAADPS